MCRSGDNGCTVDVDDVAVSRASMGGFFRDIAGVYIRFDGLYRLSLTSLGFGLVVVEGEGGEME